ncbi:MptD family putative ECF transporter S component [Dermatophilus congolensis]|uniref:Conserved hypothetical integral membrane protein n=1 Tax=Dermatophilus congolensis TaxID=1863 RepID=A0AA46BPQ3_9MICO|nr:MptD family putative ECF transporter S component [Dermatophilus congolensis]MBO3143718.1 MptD family putative ECF transporter S component [Dermatophilus congolensis]MBO3152709.1 MptD family putative ECF transporter S component [Dermatophilus congolensis]MBO3160281.1 MptD family putative ECF transporter S component [Dermatophilus congolensis]MBO3163993.1 MptD family putative ECF transporter S component [Dermatophilus congolensis]MBO3177539.1 MptD family putative ECF transporter S component [
MRLNANDLVQLGIFTSVYLVVYFGLNMIGAVSPLLQPAGIAVAVLLNGITFMLYLSRVQKFGLITLMTVLLGVLMTVAGHHPVTLITAIVCGLAADTFAWQGRYTAGLTTAVAYGVMSMWGSGAYLPLLFMREPLVAQYRVQMGDAWADSFSSLYTSEFIVTFVVVTVLVGIAGGLLGRKAVDHHFRPAGLA